MVWEVLDPGRQRRHAYPLRLPGLQAGAVTLVLTPPALWLADQGQAPLAGRLNDDAGALCSQALPTTNVPLVVGSFRERP